MKGRDQNGRMLPISLMIPDVTDTWNPFTLLCNTNEGWTNHQLHTRCFLLEPHVAWNQMSDLFDPRPSPVKEMGPREADSAYGMGPLYAT